ncbi:hypothetical protein Q3A66_15395 [Hymenobacter sp. BT770]|uniref:hypothetical protein n=1 Tax=Hymenobacter sp. BT770 TaxID=2886942 RepID=UPI001D108F62|nr:hypothetical protein [Hymenobacter sp. BT770]MCC3154481.1 hypothetical protein [Hymenobacter sp. BT770]MDO3416454.1 hypothetical protein [Hymenobacter sp. BT770]
MLLFLARLALASAFCLAGSAAWAQSKPHAQASSTHPATAPPVQDQDQATGSLSAALGYGNNSAFFGRTQATTYPYFTQELTYTSPYSVWGSVYNYDLLNTDSHFDETDFSVGYDRDLTKKVDLSLSYSHFLFAPNSPLVKSAVNNSLDAALGYDWGYVYTRLNGSYLFGPNDHDTFLVLDNSRAFDLDGIFTAKDYITITPKLSLTAGTQAFSATSAEQQILRGNKKPKTKTGPATTDASRFTLLSYGLRLPVAYTLGKVSAEVAYRYLQPVNVLPEDDSSGRSYFTATLTVTL